MLRGKQGLASRWLTIIAAFSVNAFLLVSGSFAQDEVRNFRQPILMVETGGSHAPVRSLLWEDPTTLLSGGLDKVVRAWDLRDEPRLTRTFRPMTWRGLGGVVYAMALSPKPDAAGQRLLAVAGYGVEYRRGDFTIFRVPGLERVTTGEVVARPLPPDPSHPGAIGHTNPILCLAFDPTGNVLASGSIDRTVILWDIVADKKTVVRPRAALRGHTRDVRALAFSPDGGRLATTGGDGSIRLWDVAQARQIDIRPGHPTAPIPINTLAFSPDGTSIVVGTETSATRNGRIFGFNAANLSGAAPVEIPTAAEQGPVEWLTYHPGGKQLAVSIKSDRTDIVDPMKIACDLEIRSMPDGTVTHRRRVHGMVYTAAFSPSGDRLAYAGGTAQSISIQDMSDLAKPPAELRGQGSTPFDLGFKADEGQVLGFTRDLIDPANPPQEYSGFDFADRKTRTIPANQLRRAIREYDGWKLAGSINVPILEAVHANGRRLKLDLDWARERLWWSATFLPPGPRHERPTVAIGHEAGVTIFDLDTGRRTRVFAGHSSPVVSLVPSPDGRWLASSSIDQSIMLYPLADCDQRPVFGATFGQRADGTWTIDAVAPRSFAQAMGLLVGDQVATAWISRPGLALQAFSQPQQIGQFVGQVDGLAPYIESCALLVRRTLIAPVPGIFGVNAIVYQTMVGMPSTKRNSPALTLLLGADKEWVLWTPQGYYDTSIDGDSRFLGWHINPPLSSTLPTDFVAIGAFAKTMNRPDLLRQVWLTGNLDQALAAVAAAAPKPENQAYDDQPPQVALRPAQAEVKSQPPGKVWQVSVPNPKLTLDLLAQGKRKIRELKVIFDERLLPVRKLALVEEHHENIELPLPPNRPVRLEVQALNESETQRSETIDMLYVPPPQAPAEVKPPVAAPVKPTLVVLSIGNDKFQARELPPIRFADRDVMSLADFLGKHLLLTDTARTAADIQVERSILVNKPADTLQQAFQKLQDSPRDGGLHKGDLVALVVNSHVLELDGVPAIAVADTHVVQPPAPLISGRDLAERLGELSDYGCRVVLFLDGVHDLREGPFKSEVKTWVRDLQRNRRVVTFVASKEGPSGASVRDQHGYFAQGLLNAFQAAGSVAPRRNPAKGYTLEFFYKAVRQEVLNLSNRRQEVGCYIPPAVSPATLFARP